MVFWVAILFGGLFAWLAVRLGFYETWILLFNTLISVYLGIFLALRVSAFAPGTEETSAYGIGLSMIVIAGGCFAILQGLSYVFLTGQFKIRFPQVFDIVVAGALGFLAGFVILSFVALAITTTPLAEREAVRFVGFNREAQKGTIACLARCCDLIHSMATSSPAENATQAVVDRLLDNRPPTDANDPPLTPDEPPFDPEPAAGRMGNSLPVLRRRRAKPHGQETGPSCKLRAFSSTHCLGEQDVRNELRLRSVAAALSHAGKPDPGERA